MPTKRTTRLTICWRCDEILSRNEVVHHVHLCDLCVVREHDTILLVGREPDHPEADWLAASPVDLDVGSRRKAGPR